LVREAALGIKHDAHSGSEDGETIWAARQHHPPDLSEFRIAPQ